MWSRSLILSIVLISISSASGINEKFIQQRLDLEQHTRSILNNKGILNLYGLSGMGKTTLTKVLSNLCQKGGIKTFWINWDQLSVDEQINNRRKKFNCTSLNELAVIMKKEKGSLIVVDNYNRNSVKEIKDKLEEIYPKDNSTIKLLITSREKIEGIPSFQIPPFKIDESISLMASYFPHEPKDRLERISLMLGSYPYFISVICNLIDNSNTLSLQRVEEMLDTKPKNIIVRNFSMKSLHVNSITEGNIAVKDAIEFIKKDDYPTYNVLCFLSFLNPKSIPLQLIHSYLDNEIEADRIIEKLSAMSFIASVNKKNDFITYDLHEITQKIVHQTISESERDKIIIQTVIAFSQFFRNHFTKVFNSNREDQVFFNHIDSILLRLTDDVRVLPLKILAIKSPLISKRNVKKAFSKAKDIEDQQPEVNIKDSNILFEYFIDWSFFYCFHYTDDPKNFEKGIQYAEKAIEIAKKNNDKQQIFKANSRLMWINLYAGNMERGKPYLETATSLLLDVRDPYMRKEYFFGASWYYLELGDFEKAYPLAIEGVKIDDVSKNANIGLYLRAAKATCEYRFNHPDKALQTIEEALSRELKEFGSNTSLAKAEILQIKSKINIDRENFDIAEKSIRESVSIFTRIRGDDPYAPKAVSLKILAEVLFKKGDFESANSEINRSLEMFQALLQREGTYEFGEALLLKADISLARNNNDDFQYSYKELVRSLGRDHEFIKKIQALAVNEKKEWLLF